MIFSWQGGAANPKVLEMQKEVGSVPKDSQEIGTEVFLMPCEHCKVLLSDGMHPPPPKLPPNLLKIPVISSHPAVRDWKR